MLKLPPPLCAVLLEYILETSECPKIIYITNYEIFQNQTISRQSNWSYMINIDTHLIFAQKSWCLWPHSHTVTWNPTSGFARLGGYDSHYDIVCMTLQNGNPVDLLLTFRRCKTKKQLSRPGAKFRPFPRRILGTVWAAGPKQMVKKYHRQSNVAMENSLFTMDFPSTPLFVGGPKGFPSQPCLIFGAQMNRQLLSLQKVHPTHMSHEK